MEHILLVATRETTLDSLKEMIGEQRFELSTARNQRTALRLAKRYRPHIIILDTTSPRLASRKLSLTLRRLFDVPLIAIAHPGIGLSAIYHTDCLVRPFSNQQLQEALARALQHPRELHCGDLRLDLRARMVHVPFRDEPVPLTPKQFNLLRLLIQNQGQIVTRQMMMQDVWNTAFMEDTRTLDVHIRWLRERIEENPNEPQRLVTVRGVGYTLRCD